MGKIERAVARNQIIIFLSGGLFAAFHEGQYVISFKGMLAMQNRYLFWFRNRPYKRAELKSHINNVWQFVKIAAAVLDAVILILLGWWALFK